MFLHFGVEDPKIDQHINSLRIKIEHITLDLYFSLDLVAANEAMVQMFLHFTQVYLFFYRMRHFV